MIHNNAFLNLVNTYKPQISEVSVIDVAHKFQNTHDFILIDVREESEWDKGYIPHAIHMSGGTIEINLEHVIPNKQQDIILYCGGGYRSILSAYNLHQMGYTNVYSMMGGIKAWIAQGYALSNT